MLQATHRQHAASWHLTQALQPSAHHQVQASNLRSVCTGMRSKIICSSTPDCQHASGRHLPQALQARPIIRYRPRTCSCSKHTIFTILER